MPFWNIELVPGRLPCKAIGIGTEVAFAKNLGNKNDHLAARLIRDLGDGPYTVVENDSVAEPMAKSLDHVLVQGKKDSGITKVFVPRIFLDLVRPKRKWAFKRLNSNIGADDGRRTSK